MRAFYLLLLIIISGFGMEPGQFKAMYEAKPYTYTDSQNSYDHEEDRYEPPKQNNCFCFDEALNEWK